MLLTQMPSGPGSIASERVISSTPAVAAHPGGLHASDFTCDHRYLTFELLCHVKNISCGLADGIVSLVVKGQVAGVLWEEPRMPGVPCGAGLNCAVHRENGPRSGRPLSEGIV